MSIITQSMLLISKKGKYASFDGTATSRFHNRLGVAKFFWHNMRNKRHAWTIAVFAVVLSSGVSLSLGAVGDVVATITASPSGSQRFCAIGLAFDGIDLYINRCSDPNIYAVSAQDGSMQTTKSLLEPDPSMPSIPEWPAAMSYDSMRHGLWIGTQMGEGGMAIGDCGSIGMPIYFWAFNGPGATDDTVTRVFTILFANLPVNPATGNLFFSDCTVAGLVYDEGNDEIQISDDRNRNIGVFQPDGIFLRGYDATSVHASLFNSSGLSVGDAKLYLTNGSIRDVFYADQNANSLSLIGQLVDGFTRQVDMACDPTTFFPRSVMWVRTDPQGIATNDIFRAYEIEAGGCGAGPQLGACCDPNNPPCRDVPQSACQGTWTAGVLCADLNPPCFETHRIILLDRTGSMENAVLADGRTRCLAAWETANSEIMSFFATNPIGSSVAVWTFASSSATPLTAGFVDELSAMAALAPLGNTPCAGATPLAEAVCDSVDALVAAFPVATMETLEVSISSDGAENNSSGLCNGPDSVTGMTCTDFDPGSWQQLVCDHASGNAVMLVKLWGDTNPPLSRSSQTMDTETGQLRSADISDAVFFQALVDATGGTFTFIEDNPPGPSGSPAFGVTGACCLPDTTCQESITEAECAAMGGSHQGDASICADATGACCRPDDTCQDAITLTACMGQGGSFQGTCTTCANDVMGACCLPNSPCQDGLTPTQCAAQNGTHQGGCSVCTGAPGECNVAVPTVSEWGLLLMTLLVVTAGTMILRSRGTTHTVREGMIQ